MKDYRKKLARHFFITEEREGLIIGERFDDLLGVKRVVSFSENSPCYFSSIVSRKDKTLKLVCKTEKVPVEKLDDVIQRIRNFHRDVILNMEVFLLGVVPPGMEIDITHDSRGVISAEVRWQGLGMQQEFDPPIGLQNLLQVANFLNSVAFLLKRVAP